VKAVVQRSRSARVEVNGEVVGQIDHGLTVFLGVAEGDTETNGAKLAQKISQLRIFNDESGKFNLSVKDVAGAVLLISNFTLCGDARKGNRPSFTSAASPDEANRLYEAFATLLQSLDVPVQKGVFGADMRVFVENEGPVTLVLEG
jgi:D-tyrosyl-tRNA(Tyr) deacylase